nr:MAG TPA_asm: hypothetical protein [Caudoviricetes sp.]
MYRYVRSRLRLKVGSMGTGNTTRSRVSNLIG